MEYSRRIEEGTRKLCMQSDIEEDIIMPKNVAFIEYHGNLPLLSRFTIQYHSILPVNPNCGKTFNASKGKFSTPGFPFQYPSNQKCSWTIYPTDARTLEVRFKHFHLEYHTRCDFDYVDVEVHFKHTLTVKKIGRFCGDRKPPILNIDGSRSFVVIKLKTDATINGKGFKVHFKTADS